MRETKILFAVILSLAAIALGSCGRSDSGLANIHYAVLDAKDQPLRDDFNRDRGYVRLMFLVDPRCPDCLRGLADMGDDLLSKLPKDAHVKIYVVHESVLGGTEKDIPAAAALLKTSSARHYWNPRNPASDFGREMSHVLDYWNGKHWIYAWDTWLIYPPDAVWAATPPKPVWLMHQLDGLRGNPKFPPLDGKIFAAKVNAMLATLNAKNASR